MSDTPFDTEALLAGINTAIVHIDSDEVVWKTICDLIAAESAAVGDVVDAYTAAVVSRMTPFFAQFGSAWQDSVREALHTISELPSTDRPPVPPTPAAP